MIGAVMRQTPPGRRAPWIEATAAGRSYTYCKVWVRTMQSNAAVGNSFGCSRSATRVASRFDESTSRTWDAVTPVPKRVV